MKFNPRRTCLAPQWENNLILLHSPRPPSGAFVSASPLLTPWQGRVDTSSGCTPMRTLRAWAVFFGVFAAAVPAIAQSVISAHSGLIYYFDGFVYLDGQQLQPHLGKFPSVPQGTELRTGLGRAEVVLTPGVFLRVGDKSAIRMLSNDLAD